MTLTLDTVAEFGKSLSVKREKSDDDAELIVCKAQFSEAFVDRDFVDRIAKQLSGWAQCSLYDSQGAPLLECEIALTGAEWQTVGRIIGGGDPARVALNLGPATLHNIVLRPVALGARMSASLSWSARGDEVEDVSGLLGALVSVRMDLSDGGQADLFRDAA